MFAVAAAVILDVVVVVVVCVDVVQLENQEESGAEDGDL